MSLSDIAVRLPVIPAVAEAATGERGEIHLNSEGPFDESFWSNEIGGDYGRMVYYVTGDWRTGEVTWEYSGESEVLIEGDNLHLVVLFNGNTVSVTATVGDKSDTMTIEFPPF